MATSSDCWGLEVGSNAIKAVRLVRKKDRIVVADYDVLPFKKVLTTPDLNVAEAVQVNLDKFLSRHVVNRSKVVVSVPGHRAFSRFAKLPPVDPKKIPAIVRFEAAQQIPFPIDQVEWDYNVFSQADSPDVEVGIFAITKERVEEELGNYRAVGLNIDAMTLSSLAVYNAMYHDYELDEESPGVIFIDIGTTSTDVIIADQGRLWLRTLPIGGNTFTEALVRAFKLNFPKAEKLKCEAGTSKYLKQIFQAMRPVFADLVQELQKTLGFYQSLNRDANLTKLVGMGSTFRLPGLSKFLRQQLQMEVVRPETFSRVDVPDKQAAEFAEQALNMATAMGCALQGLGEARVDANIMPEQILRQRLWRAKQPWIGAAAGLMLAATAGAGVSLMMERSIHTEKMSQTKPNVDRTMAQATNLVRELQGSDAGVDPRQEIENLRRVLDYRDIWPNLMLDLSLASKSTNPQPAFLTGNYDLIDDIARRERRRIYIDSVAVDYQVGRAELQNLDPNQPPPEGELTNRPQFVITIRGSTPHARQSQFISATIMQWLSQNVERPDRPYRIIRGSPRLRPGEAITRTAVIETPTRPVRGGVGRPVIGGVEPAVGQVAASPLQRPTAAEDPSSDWPFVITWTVEVIPPEDARKEEAAEEGEGAELQASLPADPRRAEDAEGQL